MLPAAGTLIRPESFSLRAKCRGILLLLAPCLLGFLLALRWSLETGSLRRMLCSADCFHAVCVPWLTNPMLSSSPVDRFGQHWCRPCRPRCAWTAAACPVARQLQPAPIPCYSCPAQGLGLGRAVRGPLSLRGGTRPSLSGNAETPLQR